MTKMDASRKFGTIESEGFTLNYIIEGRGKPILVIGSSLYDHRVFSPELRKSHRWFFVDHRGFGIAPAGTFENSAFDLAVLLSDIERARVVFGLSEFVIVGHSGHAFMAIEYAKKYPQYVKGVVLTGCGPSNSDERRKASWEYFEATASPERKKFFESGMKPLADKIQSEPEKRFVHYCLCAGAQGWYDPSFDATYLWDGLTTNMQMFDHVWGVIFRDIDITSGLDRFNTPTLLMLGRYDYLTGPPELWNNAKPLFHNIREKIFEQSAHCPQYEESTMFNETLLKWLRDIDYW
ncbi:MAG TPA: alpha/beta hydrolase [Chryseolinea sp.]